MTTPLKRARVLITFAVILILIGGTFIAISFAKGYRPSFGRQITIKGTGLLSATSYPKSAQVFINDHLTDVTDSTLYLTPGDYQVKIIKNGFHTWQKTFPVKSELVSLTDARLFPSIPAVTPITFYQASNVQVSPDANRALYVLTGSPFKQDNGVYVVSLADGLLGGTQITQLTDMSTYDYTKADFLWSPDSNQILAIFHDGDHVTASHLLNTKGMNQTKNLIDTTIRLTQIFSQWTDQLVKINQNNLSRLPDFMTQIATESAVNVYFSPDKEKFFYTANTNLDLPENTIGKSLSNINPTPETRKLESGKTYVYDTKEGTNYLVANSDYNPNTAIKLAIDTTQALTPTPATTPSPKKSATPPVIKDTLSKQIATIRGQSDSRFTTNITWYSTSRHLIVTTDNGVSIVEYDGSNPTQITSAQLSEGFAVGSPDGSHLIILSNQNQKSDVFNLLSLDLK